ncbi:serine/threonine-protein kinase [Nocardia seriolae]|uniref:serine/threonine-protein kinase n=1 Tax=Nocardia seriolae TaxID=37332 RepID=UPI00090A9621|nr:serine/threonine-protein kinase [Nocardia seriolae]BAW06648.1 conserved hypothetical protein [Nocardia seriolae]
MIDGSWRAGTMFGPYRLDRLIGRGGMGEVYEAYDTVKDRSVALKVLTERLAEDPRFRQRFQREAHVAARLKEAHVIPIHDYGEIEGRLFLDMRLVEGKSLRDMVEDDGPLRPERAVAIIEQVAAALDAAHRDSLVHRDVKPDNILVSGDDFVYLVDFGIANTMTAERLTTIGEAIGSFSYMAPERFADSQTTPAADIYALACVLHETLTGLEPFHAQTAAQLMRAHLYTPPPAPSALRPGLPPALDQVVMRGMAKNPGDRYPTAGMLAAAAKAALVPDSKSDPTRVLPAPPSSTFPPGPLAAPMPATVVSQPMPVVSQPMPGVSQPMPVVSQPSVFTSPPFPYTPPPAAAPPRPPRRGRILLIAGIVALVVSLVVGVGIWRLFFYKSGGNGVDVNALDVGNYTTTPRKMTGQTTKEEGRAMAAMALAEGLPDPYQIDKALDHRLGNVLSNPGMAATAIAGTGTPLTQPVMEKYGMVSAYAVTGVTKRYSDWIHSPDGNALIMVIMSYPNSDSAANAAKEMEAVDYAASAANVRVDIPKFPQAHAHYRPGYASIGATWSYNSFVTSVIAVLDNPNFTPAMLAERAGQVFAAEAPLLDKVDDYAEAALTVIPRDPDQVIRRVLVTDEQPISATYGSIGPRAASLCEDAQSHKDGLFEQAGIDRCAFTIEGGVLRTRDESAARAFLTAARKADAAEYVKRDIKPPTGLPTAICYEQKDAIWSDDANSRFSCGVAYGRYVGLVESNDEQDVLRRIAAQYTILTKS